MRSLLLPLLLFSLTLQAQTVLIKNATVVNVRNGQLLKNTDILIEKNRIKSIGKGLRPGAGAVIIDANKKYVIPGLWDMHIHALGRWERAAPLCVANGVTGIRDMANVMSLPEAKKLKQHVLDGNVVGPRIINGARLLDGSQSRFPQVAILIPTKEYAATVADSLKREGVDFYKVYETLPKEAFYAIIEKGKEHGLAVAGHVPASITLDEAINAGMKSIEHLKFVGGDESIPTAIRDSIRMFFRTAMWDISQKDTVSAMQKNKQGSILAAQYYNPEIGIKKGKLLAEHNIWITPTLVQSIRSYYNKDELLRNKSWDYVPAPIAGGWRYRVANDIKLMRFDIPEYALLELKTIEGFHKSQVKLLAGTDANDAFIGNIMGFGVHEELKLFVKAGLSNLEALQTATLNPAIFLGATDSLGTIEPGKIADILILDANPLQQISNTEKISGVILNGRYLDRRKLDSLLEKVKMAAGNITDN